MLFSVLFASWTSRISAFHGDVVRELAAQFMALAEKQKATAPFMDGHRMIGISCLFTGDLMQARENLDRAIALYEPTHGRSVGVDARAGTLARRSWALWLRDLLAGVYGSFSEGFDTLDLKAARALLDKLGS